MAVPSKRTLTWLGAVATFVATLVGLASLGWAWPWNALTEEKHTQIHKNLEERHEAVLQDIATQLRQLNEKLPERRSPK
jgi:hypothetical protein